MNDDDWIEYCKERKEALERYVEELERQIISFKNDIEFYERQIKEKGSDKNEA